MKCPYSFATESKLKSHEKVCKDHDYCHMIIRKKDKSSLKYNQDKKCLRAPFVIYADIESLLEKIIQVIIIQKNLLQQK